MAAVDPLTPAERHLRLALRIFAALSALYLLGYLVPGLGGPGSDEWVHPPFVVNSVAKDGLFVCVALLAAADVRRFSGLVWIVIVGHVFLILTLAATLALGNGEGLPTWALWAWMGGDVLVIAVLFFLYDRAQRARHELEYLSHAAFASLAALAEVIVEGEDERVPPADVAHNVDRWLARLDARGKGTVRLALLGLALYPLLSLHFPFPAMAPDARRRFLEKRFERVSRRRLRGFRRTLTKGLLRLASQMAYVGYYTDRRSHASVGYVRFADRPEGKGVQPTPRPRLRPLKAGELNGRRLEADVVVVGSGAGGSVVAQRLAERGKSVIVLERGRHHPPETFTDDELDQLSKLYSDGGFQLSRDFSMQILQGMCVGGSTVVNNGVCIDPPEVVLARWNAAGAGLDLGDLSNSIAAVRSLLGVARQEPGVRLNPGWVPFDAGVKALELDRPPFDYQVVDANIDGCLGCGYCNIGCSFGRKLSMLDGVLPQAQERFGDGFRVVAECGVRRIERSNGRATGVVCRPRDGGDELAIRAGTVVVAGGAIASSFLLQRSGLGGRDAGRGLCFNVGSPIHADFAQPVHAYAGLQISHVLAPPPERGFAIETWFNPAGTQALVMPGWFRDHYENMRRYSHMAAAGVIYGSRTLEERIRPARFGTGPDVAYKPTREELDRLLEGLKLAGEIFLEAGAERVMPSTFRFHELRSKRDLDRLGELVRDGGDISLNTAHPQGGNALGRVLDDDFRVRGTQNVHVCDASVFPSSVTVNPQLTVMALADYAAPRIAG